MVRRYPRAVGHVSIYLVLGRGCETAAPSVAWSYAGGG